MKNAQGTSTTEAAAVAEQGAHVAPEKAASKKTASPKKGAPKGPPKGQRVAKGGKTKAAAPKHEAKTANKAAQAVSSKTNSAPRAESKGARIIEMIGRANGATLAEILKTTNWQAHSVRGFISTAAKKKRIIIESAKNEAGDRVYRIAK